MKLLPQKQIANTPRQPFAGLIVVALALVFFAAATAQASTTISGTYVGTSGTLTVTGLSTLGNASSTLFSAYGPAYFGATATSSFSAAGVLSLISALTVANGGTGAATFGQGWLHSSGGTSALTSSTSPTVNYITATSTTATSTFSGGFTVGTSQFVVQQTSGNIGVGTTSPWGKVSVSNGALTSPAFAVATGTNQTAFVVDSNGDTRPYGRLMLPMGEISYFSTTGTLISIATQSNGSTNLVKVGPTTSLTNDLEFDNGGADNGRMRYIGATTRVFHTAFTISMDGEGAGTNLYVFGIAKNGTVGSCKVIQSIAVSNDTQSTALHCMVTLATNDYLELYVGNLTDTDDITVKATNLFALGM